MQEASQDVLEAQMMRKLGRLLEDLTDLRVQKIESESNRGGIKLDAYIDAEPYQFLVECKGSGTAAPVARATLTLKKASRLYDLRQGRTIPLVVVPFMGSVGKGICREAGVAWVDLAGNARISAPGLHVHVEGRPSRFERSTHGFGPRSSRVTRHLLLDPKRTWTLRKLKETTGLSERFVARTVDRLRDDGLVAIARGGLVSVPDPRLLLDAWHEVYDFAKHRILRGHIASRSGEALLARLAQVFQGHSLEHAATGLAAAWKLAPSAGFRIVTFYVSSDPGAALLDSAGFREMERGANVWLVLPNDKGVFHGCSKHGGVMCVSAVQTYLDLKGHPERAAEAAEVLRAECLSWSNRG